MARWILALSVDALLLVSFCSASEGSRKFKASDELANPSKSAKREEDLLDVLIATGFSSDPESEDPRAGKLAFDFLFEHGNGYDGSVDTINGAIDLAFEYVRETDELDPIEKAGALGHLVMAAGCPRVTPKIFDHFLGEGRLDADLVQQFLEPILAEAVDMESGKLKGWAHAEVWKVIYPLARLGQSKYTREYLDHIVDGLIHFKASLSRQKVHPKFLLANTFLPHITGFIQAELQSKLFELEVILSYACLPNDIDHGKPISEAVQFLFGHKPNLLRQEQLNRLFEEKLICPFNVFHRTTSLLPRLDPLKLVTFWCSNDAVTRSAFLPILAVLKGIEESNDLDGFLGLTVHQKNVMVSCAKASFNQALYDSIGSLIWSLLPSPTVKVLSLMLPEGCPSLSDQLLGVVQEPSKLPPHFLPLFLNQAQLDLLPKAFPPSWALQAKILELIRWDFTFFLFKPLDEGDLRALKVYNQQIKRSAEFKAIVRKAIDGSPLFDEAKHSLNTLLPGLYSA